jgi:hypothetical protein
MFRFRFDHACSDGARGYGAVEVTTPEGHVHYIGRAFAVTVLPSRFPEAGLTFEDAATIVTYLSDQPSFTRQYTKTADGDLHYDDC